MANLLDQASIVLTPTAYDNGKVLCAKPSEAPYGDFDFSRNSAATRVNAQGLVENVQILSSNLVQNGDFSEEGVQEVSNGSFSQEGVQLVTNGSFDTDSDWTKQTGWSISGGSANCDGTQTSNTNLTQTNIINDLSKTYKVEFTLSNYVSGSVKSKISNDAQGVNRTANGTYVDYLSGMTNTQLNFTANSDFIGSIDNVSVREVGQDWTLGTGWSIGEDKAIQDGTGNGSSVQQSNILVVGKTYKITYEILERTQGSIQVFAGFPNSNVPSNNTIGVHTHYIKAEGNTNLYLLPSNFIGSITNISVKEVGMDWLLGSGWSIGEDKAITDGSDTSVSGWLRQNNILTAGKTYTFSCSVETSDTGRVGNVNDTHQSLLDIDNGSGEYTTTFTAVGSGLAIAQRAGKSFSITNISVIEITDDTNLPRINYEGFSYQDALGSEQVVNGTFDTNVNGWVTNNANATFVWQPDKTGLLTSTSFGYAKVSPPLNLNAAVYKVSFDILSFEGTLSNVHIGLGNAGNVITTTGSYSYFYTSTGGSTEFQIRPNSGGTGSIKIDNVSVKEYSGQIPIPNSGCGSWLFEPQSTNLIPYSETGGNWDTQTGTVVINTYEIAPDGILGNVLTFTPSVLNGSLSGASNNTGNRTYPNEISFTNSQVTNSIYFKSTNKSSFNASIKVVNKASDTEISTKTVLVTDKWQRFEVTGTVNGGANGCRFVVKSEQAVNIWGLQVEQQSYATSYIPTSGSTVTRNQDLCTNGGSLATINSTEGVLYAEIAKNNAANQEQLSIGLNSGSTSNRVLIYFSPNGNTVRCQVRTNRGGTTVTPFSASVNLGTQSTDFNKIAVKYKENDFALWVNGIEIYTGSTGLTPVGLDRLNFDPAVTNGKFFGKTKALAVWKEALSDEELAELTYPTPTDPTFSLDFDTIAEQFTFARGSEATYVDAQGLIKSTNEIGEELITNGTFDSDTAWSLPNGTDISNGLLNFDGSQSGTINVNQSIPSIDFAKTYKVTFTVSNYISGIVKVKMSNNAQGSNINSNGTYTEYLSGMVNNALSISGNLNFTGSIDNVSVKEYITETNTPRLDYSTGAEAFLLEPQSTNLVTHSEDFTQSWWFASTADVVLSTNLSPNGTQNAYKVTYGASGNRLGGANFSLPNTPHTNSIYMRKISGSGVVDFKDQVGLSNIINLTEDWQRYSITQTLVDGTARLYVDLQTSGDVVEVWGAQQEALPYSTSYVPTSGSTVTRNQETCTNATPEINSEEGVLYAEISALANDGTFRVLGLSDGTNTNRAYIGYSLVNQYILCGFDVNSTSIYSLSYNTTDITSFIKVALKYKQNDFALWVNGVEVSSQSSGNTFPIGTLTQMQFTSGTTSSKFFGNTKDLQVYTKALSDAELIKLTT